MDLQHLTNVMGSTSLMAFAVLAFAMSGGHAAPRGPAISIVADSELGPGATHGLGKTAAALESKGIVSERAAALDAVRGRSLLVVGLAAGPGAAARLLQASGIEAPTLPESLVIHHTEWNGKPALLVTGADDRGLMYAELDVADRIGWAPNARRPLSKVKDAAERPAVPERALSIYTMHRAYFESRFYDEHYWARYLDMLAENRFNTFALLFGYSPAAYLAPPYPFFFDVEGFPEVRVEGLTKEQQQRNVDALNRVIRMTHERGLSFTLGIWDHIPRGDKQSLKGLPVGVTRENLVPYTKAALAKFLRLVPELDAIQFRMHGESGLKRDEFLPFWTNVFEVINESGRDIRVDARAKGLPDAVIDRALEMGIDIRITTKYWMEQMGLPFHPTHIHPNNQRDRRHGYADLLRYPQKYKMHWKLWNGGTTRVLLWGDPEYVRRFAESTHLYDGEGFEVNEPLATKMALHEEEEPFELLRPAYQYYDYEFERYWHFFQSFGRLGYNPDTPSDIWETEFERRFGKRAGPLVQQALHRASQILPRIVAYTYPYNLFPTLGGWAGKHRMADLPDYAEALPSDTEQFLRIDDAAQNRIEGRQSAKIHPEQSSEWFAQAAGDVLELVSQAEKRIGRKKNKEFVSTIVDLRILANLALYHSRRAQAGLSYALFRRSQDLNALDDAIDHEGQAIAAWEKLVEAAGDVYHDNLMMGRGRISGHWRDELVELKEGLNELLEEKESFRPEQADEKLAIAHVPVRRLAPGEDLVIRATVSGPQPPATVRVAYRGARGDVSYAGMEQSAPLLYRATIAAADVREGLSYFIEAADERGRRASYPKAIAGEGKSNSIAVTVTNDSAPPRLTHQPITSARAQRPLTVTAEVRDPSGVNWVRLRYRNVTQFQDYQTLPMLPTGKKDEYQAVVPGEHIVSEWDFMYFIEVMDNAGNGRIYPDLERETPYVVVRLQRDDDGHE